MLTILEILERHQLRPLPEGNLGLAWEQVPLANLDFKQGAWPKQHWVFYCSRFNTKSGHEDVGSCQNTDSLVRGTPLHKNTARYWCGSADNWTVQYLENSLKSQDPKLGLKVSDAIEQIDEFYNQSARLPDNI